MTLLLMPYPDIDPVIFSIGPFAIRWYALAYIAGLMIGWRIMRRVCQQPPGSCRRRRSTTSCCGRRSA